MKELLYIEYLKIKNYTVFKAFMLLFIVLLPLLFYALSLIDIPMITSGKKIFNFPHVWEYLTWIAGWFNFLPGILIVTLIGNEITFKTQKQNVIDGLSKKEVILSKLYLMLVLAIFITLYILINGLIFGAVTSGVRIMFNGIEQVLYYFLQTIGFFAVAVFLAVALRKSALGVIAFLLVFAFGGLIIEQFVPDALSIFLPLNLFSDLTPNPFWEDMSRVSSSTNLDVIYEIPQILRGGLALLYSVGIILLSYVVMKKRDL